MRSKLWRMVAGSATVEDACDKLGTPLDVASRLVDSWEGDIPGITKEEAVVDIAAHVVEVQHDSR